MAVSEACWRKGWCDVDPTKLVLLLGVITSMPISVKLNQEMRPWECGQTDTQIYTETDWQTQTGFIICPMLYAIAMGQIMIDRLWAVWTLQRSWNLFPQENHSGNRNQYVRNCLGRKVNIRFRLIVIEYLTLFNVDV